MTTIHVDESGNIRKGPPLPLPTILDGIYETSTRSSYLNVSGNESFIPPPVTGRRALSSLSGEQLRSATAEAEPVENGLHHGHIMNDENGEVDAGQLSGINQVAYAPFMRMLYTPHSSEGSMFTSQKRTPHGAPANEGPGLPRAPGGGVASRAALAGDGGFRGGGLNGGGLGGRTKRANVTDFDAGRSNQEEDRRVELLNAHGAIGGPTNRLKMAQQRAFSGGWNPLEMMSEQAAKVLSDAGTYALTKGAKTAGAILHHGIHSASNALKGAFGVHKNHKKGKKDKKKKKKSKKCSECSRKGKACRDCR